MVTAGFPQLDVIAVGAHPDDVGFGAGGIVASYVKRGHRATILNVTYGETVRPPGPQQEEAKRIRRKEGEDIARKLGAEVVFLGRPGNTMLPIQPQSLGLADRIWWGSGSRETAVWAGEQGMNLMSSTLLLEDTQVPFDQLQA